MIATAPSGCSQPSDFLIDVHLFSRTISENFNQKVIFNISQKLITFSFAFQEVRIFVRVTSHEEALVEAHRARRHPSDGIMLFHQISKASTK